MTPSQSRLFLVPFGILALSFGLWRGIVAFEHYQASLAILHDPSMRELEEVAALFDGVVALLSFGHGVAAYLLSRRRVVVNSRLLLAITVFCGLWVAAALSQVALLSIPGIYPVGIVVGVFLLSSITYFSWLSVYLGGVLGATVAWFGVVPAADLFACVFVVLPCVALALLGAFCSYLLNGRKEINGVR